MYFYIVKLFSRKFIIKNKCCKFVDFCEKKLGSVVVISVIMMNVNDVWLYKVNVIEKCFWIFLK